MFESSFVQNTVKYIKIGLTKNNGTFISLLVFMRTGTQSCSGCYNMFFIPSIKIICILIFCFFLKTNFPITTGTLKNKLSWMGIPEFLMNNMSCHISSKNYYQNYLYLP